MISEREAREATVWRLLRQTYLRLIGHYTGTDLLRARNEDQNLALDRWHRSMEADLALLSEALRAARSSGIAEVHRRLHSAENTDHEMLDQAIEYADTEDA